MVKRLLVLCGLAALLAVPVATAATPTVTVNPASPIALQGYTISGCGYPASAALLVTIHQPSLQIVGQNVTADSAGCFTSAWTAGGPGGYHADVDLRVKQGSKFRLYPQASVDYTVVLP